MSEPNRTQATTDQEQAFLDRISGACTFYENGEYGYCESRVDRPTMGHYLYAEWVIGGDRGGDCYGNEYGPHEREPEPEFTDLDDVLARVCPGISFLQYKRLLATCVARRETEKTPGYYGERIEYGTKRVELRDLYAFLAGNNLL